VLRILAGVTALAIGFVSGLPFRQSEKAQAADKIKGGKHLPSALGASHSLSPDEEAVLVMTTDDPDVLRRAFDRGLTSGRDSSQSLSWLIAKRWAQLDPEGMYQHLNSTGGFTRSHPGAIHSTIYTSTLFEEWVKTDVERAIAASLELSKHRSHADYFGLAKVGDYLIMNDVERAKALGSEFAEEFSYAVRQQFYNTESKLHVMDFWAGVEPTGSRDLLSDSMARWIANSRGNPAAPWDWLSSQSQDVKGRIFKRLAEQRQGVMTGEMLDALQEYVGENPNLGSKFVSSYAGDLVERSGFEDALEWASESLRGAGRQEAMAALFAQAQNADMTQLLGAYDALPEGNLRDSAGPSVVSRMARDGDGPAALQWIEDQEFSNAQRARTTDTWVREFARSDANGAAEFINGNEGELATELFDAVTHGMTTTQREGGPRPLSAGVTWLLQLESDDVAAAAADKIFRGYYPRNDTAEARTQAEAITRPAVRAAALHAVEELEASQE